jgi:hypothetical protein
VRLHMHTHNKRVVMRGGVVKIAAGFLFFCQGSQGLKMGAPAHTCLGKFSERLKTHASSEPHARSTTKS